MNCTPLLEALWWAYTNPVLTLALSAAVTLLGYVAWSFTVEAFKALTGWNNINSGRPARIYDERELVRLIDRQDDGGWSQGAVDFVSKYGKPTDEVKEAFGKYSNGLQRNFVNYGVVYQGTTTGRYTPKYKDEDYTPAIEQAERNSTAKRESMSTMERIEDTINNIDTARIRNTLMLNCGCSYRFFPYDLYAMSNERQTVSHPNCRCPSSLHGLDDAD